MPNWKLKARIIENFGTQADFGQAIGIDEVIVSKIVRGRRRLSPDAASKWAAALKCDVNELLL